jgi:carbon storage regulator
MIVLSRKKNESIVINNDITVTVVEIRGDKVRLGVVAPREVPVHRQEVYDAIHHGTPTEWHNEPTPAPAVHENRSEPPLARPEPPPAHPEPPPVPPELPTLLSGGDVNQGLREFFAAHALQGILAGCWGHQQQGISPEHATKRALEYADAMLAELGKSRPESL